MPFNIHSHELLQPLIKVEEDAALAKEEYMESDMFFLEDELQYEGDIDCEKSLFELADCYDCGTVISGCARGLGAACHRYPADVCRGKPGSGGGGFAGRYQALHTAGGVHAKCA